MWRHLLVLLLAVPACSDNKKSTGESKGGGGGLTPEQAAAIDAEVSAKFKQRHPDCDRVVTRELREKFSLLRGRGNWYDDYGPSETKCTSFRGTDRSASFRFKCSVNDRERENEKYSSANWEDAIAVPSLGRKAWVNGEIMTIVDDDTDCVISIQAFRDKDHLSGKALIDFLGELPAGVVKQLTAATLLDDAEVKRRADDALKWGDPLVVDCDKVLDDAARAAYPGGLSWGEGKHKKDNAGWDCKPLRDSAGKEIEVELQCYRSRNTARRVIDEFGGNMAGPPTRFPMAAADAFIGGTVAILLDHDTNCAVNLSFTLLDGTLDEHAARSAEFAKRVLANLTSDKITIPKSE